MAPLLSLFIAILLIIVLVVRFKVNPAVSMFFGALFMGISTGTGLMATVSALTSGFGGTLGALGFSVGFGIMMGQLVAATGAVQVIARGVLRAFGEKRADYAMGTTGFIVSVPVFYDVAFVVLVPLARALAKASKKSVAFFTSAVVFGAGYAHTFIPPTPGPMTAAELAGVELGQMILWGTVVGLPTVFFGMLVYKKLFLDRPNFITDKDFDDLDAVAVDDSAADVPANAPGMLLAMVPILLPILLILMGTIVKLVMGDGMPEILSFLSDKSVAMFIGFLAALLLCVGRLSLTEIQKQLNDSFGAVGSVLFITGTGGALGAVIQASGVGDALVSLIGQLNIPLILFVWLVSALMRVAQGSGTVAMITAITMVVPMLPTSGVAPVWVALAACSGSFLISHVNDSGFWVTTKLAGYSTSGGLKTYTIPGFIMAVFSFLLIIPLSIIF